MLRGQPPKPPRPDTPKSRFLKHLRDGSPPLVALAKTAQSYGLDTERPVQKADGSVFFVDIPWTLDDLYRLHFYRFLASERKLTEWPAAEEPIPLGPPTPSVRLVPTTETP